MPQRLQRVRDVSEMIDRGCGAETIRANGGEALPLQCDLSDDEQVRGAVVAAIERFGTVDAVFYNAAHYDQRPRTSTSTRSAGRRP